tara:strand:- start:51 stop:542 length:492 start_codon:yes stop_codon:yes gene_type:complete
MSLRDQLLKAGVASKKQAKKASHEAKQQQRKKNKKKKKKGQLEAKDDVKIAIEQKKAEQKERDKKLNQVREEERRVHELRSQISNIINSHASFDLRANCDYHFIVEDTLIKKVRVNEKQAESLAKGNFGILEWGEEFHILNREKCLKIREFEPNINLCLHPKS